MIITDRSYLKNTKCQDVTLEQAKETVLLLEKGLEWSEKNKQTGIGLAAIQIGIPQKVAIVRLPDAQMNLANAYIEKYYDPFTFKNEGCLSIPGMIKSTIRYQEIVVKGNLFEPHEFIATGMLAIAIQHEIDHLNNVLIYEREEPPAKKGFVYSSKKKKGKRK